MPSWGDVADPQSVSTLAHSETEFASAGNGLKWDEDWRVRSIPGRKTKLACDKEQVESEQ